MRCVVCKAGLDIAGRNPGDKACDQCIDEAMNPPDYEWRLVEKLGKAILHIPSWTIFKIENDHGLLRATVLHRILIHCAKDHLPTLQREAIEEFWKLTEVPTAPKRVSRRRLRGLEA